MSKKPYRNTLLNLQVELVKLQWHFIKSADPAGPAYCIFK